LSRASSWAAGSGRQAATTFVAFVATLAVMAALIGSLGVNPLSATSSMVRGALGNEFNLGQTTMTTSLLVLTGLAAAIPFSARLWNVGGEGQLYFGAFTAAALALTISPSVPHWLFAPIVVIGSAVGGAVWGLVPGLLKAVANANEVITSLMMTFIAIALVDVAIVALWPEGFGQQTRTIPPNSTLPVFWKSASVDVGAPIAAVAVVIAWFLMKRTRAGFEIRAAGLNPGAALLNGIRIKRVAAFTFAIGGAFAGLAGAIQVAGIAGTLSSNFSASYGFIGIAVALIARLDPLWIVPSAFLFSVLTVGSNALQADTGLAPDVGTVLVGLFVILLLGLNVIRLRYAEAVGEA
jgi:general nucleoside transport system permease protein